MMFENPLKHPDWAGRKFETPLDLMEAADRLSKRGHKGAKSSNFGLAYTGLTSEIGGNSINMQMQVRSDPNVPKGKAVHTATCITMHPDDFEELKKKTAGQSSLSIGSSLLKP